MLTVLLLFATPVFEQPCVASNQAAAEKCENLSVACTTLAEQILTEQAFSEKSVNALNAVFPRFESAVKYQVHATKATEEAIVSYNVATSDGDRLRACAELADALFIYAEMQKQFVAVAAELAEIKLSFGKNA